MKTHFKYVNQYTLETFWKFKKAEMSVKLMLTMGAAITERKRGCQHGT
jgi:hypothetical protein